MEINNFQRLGSISNSHAGADFENDIRLYFKKLGIELIPNFGVQVGHLRKKLRRFDLGSNNPALLVECKSHAWTATGNVPSAKITVWHEAMYYFHLAPAEYRKILFVLKHIDKGRSLAAYYLKHHDHLVPEGVEVWEFDIEAKEAERLK